MKRLLESTVFLALLATSAVAADDKDKPKPKDAAAPTHESLTKEMIGTFGKMASLFESVKDEKSAAAAKAKLGPLVAEMDQYNDKFAKVGPMTPDVTKRLDEKFKAELDTTFTKWAAEYTRVKEQPYGKDLVDMLKSRAKPPAAAPKGPTPPTTAKSP